MSYVRRRGPNLLDGLDRTWTMDLPTADHALTDSEVQARFGAILAAGVRAFREDPALIVALAEAAGASKRKREKRPKVAAPKRKPKPAKKSTPEPQPKPVPRQDLAARVVRRRKQGASLATVAREFNVSESTASRYCIAAGVTKRRANAVLTDEDRLSRDRRIVGLMRSGVTVSEVARQVGLSRTAVRKILAAHDADTP